MADEEAYAGVEEKADGSWSWWARWRGGVELSPDDYPSRQAAVEALLNVLRED